MASETGSSTSFDWVKWVAWLETNKKRVAIWSGTAVVVVVGISAIVYVQSRKEVWASQALSDVVIPMPPGRAPAPGTAEKLLAVEQNHRGTKAAARALLEAAGIRYVEGNHSEAEALFRRFEQEYPESVWLPQAIYGRAAALDAAQQNAEATSIYERLRKQFPADPVAEDVKLSLARLYERQNKLEDALTLYEEVLRANLPMFSSLGAEAEVRKDALLERHPELVKTNVPVVIPPPVMLPDNTNVPTHTGASRVITIPVTNVATQTNIDATVPAAPVVPATNVPVPAPPPSGVSTSSVPVPAPAPTPAPAPALAPVPAPK